MPNSEHSNFFLFSLFPCSCLCGMCAHIWEHLCEWLFIRLCARACSGPRSMLGTILDDSSLTHRAWDTVSLSSHLALGSEPLSLRLKLQVGYHGCILLIL